MSVPPIAFYVTNPSKCPTCAFFSQELEGVKLDEPSKELSLEVCLEGSAGVEEQELVGEAKKAIHNDTDTGGRCGESVRSKKARLCDGHEVRKVVTTPSNELTPLHRTYRITVLAPPSSHITSTINSSPTI